MKNKLKHTRRVTLFRALSILMLVTIMLFGQTPYSYENQLDINNAEYEQIAKLPVSSKVAEKLYERIQYRGPFTSIFQLREIEGIDQVLLNQLRPLIRIEPYVQRSERESRIEQLYFSLDRWAGREGTNQALVDSWIEQALEPIDINRVRYDQLLNLSGVSPVDAAAIINYRNNVGLISSLRDLRSAPYLSWFGYRNTRDFVSFEEREIKRAFHGNLLFRSSNTPFFNDEVDAGEGASLFASANDYPDIYTRFIGSYGPDIKLGYSYWHALSEPVLSNDLGIIEWPKGKFYVGFENKNLGPLEVRKVYVGNYALAFGQGVVMENTDFFSPRKTGYGFRKRFIGLAGDNSRTRQYQFTGLATELAFKNAHLFLFGAFDERDAILNTTPVLIDGEEILPVNQLVVLNQRFEYAPGDQAREDNDISWRNSVKELTYGFHAAYDLFPATQIGLTYYESAYDRPLRPTFEEIVEPANFGEVSLPDNEVIAAYGGEISDSENPFWGDAKSFRRVYGVDVSSTFKNVSLQAEYAELDKGQDLSLFGTAGDNPWAFVGSAYMQYNSFNLLGLYRNYKIGFDNPYQRSYSNYRRYKRSIYEDFFYLRSPFYNQLYENNPQPQAEEGFYFSTRYQMSRQFTLTAEYDNWLRNADGVSQFRLRGTLQYRPIFPVSLSLYQKYQGREVQNNVSLEYFETNEFRGTLRFRLSRFSDLSLLYLNAVTKFRSRPRFAFPAEPNDPGEPYDDTNFAGIIASPSQVIGGGFTHNVNEWLKLRAFMTYYEGFFWNFEDTQFFVVNNTSGAMRYWFSVYSRISNNVSLRMKYTRDRSIAITAQQARDGDNQPIENNGGRYYQSDLVQPRQEFFYVEMNVNF